MVDYFSCALENHQISGPKRCLSTKNVLNDRYKIVVNFSWERDNYCI